MKTIGRFTVSGLLGKGGMGKVFKIEYPVTGKICAMKLLDPQPLLVDLLGQQAIEEMFTAEAITMARIRHPHITEILDFDSHQGKLYYIMEFYCNNLGTMIGEGLITEDQSRVLSVEKAIHYTRQTLEGLACLHHAGIIHRDIKPFNLLLTDLDAIKLCDFGLSKLRGETLKGHQSLKIGSPYYASPEQEADPENVDMTTDLYSVAVMMFRMLTGRLPDSPDQAPSRYNPDLDDHWDAFILKGMAGNPEDRHTSAKEMIRELDDLARHWQEKKAAICAAPADLFDDPRTDIPHVTVRDQARKTSKTEARTIFGLNERMQPASYVTNRFTCRSGEILCDETTGLCWQQSGTPYPVNWNEAGDYVRQLNQERFGGYDTWRLPTINELATLITPTPQGSDHCMEPVFDPGQKWLWSCDRCTYITAWYVSLDMGFVAYNDFSSYYHVKAVCTV